MKIPIKRMQSASHINLESHILRNLQKCGIELFPKKTNLSQLKDKERFIGVAVSGGADSTCLLFALFNICKNQNIKCVVININHNIREVSQSKNDSDFVKALCKKLNEISNILIFEQKVLKQGEVEKLSKSKDCGIEDAARILRYDFFNECKNKYSLEFIATAHTKNDQIETILMRFLQGSSGVGRLGIRIKRDFYVRPLLDVSRNDIECYLRKNNLTWCNDDTNFDNSYLRNRIRNLLIPFLNDNFKGFDSAVLSGAKKNNAEEEVLSFLASNVQWNTDEKKNTVFCKRKEYCEQKKAIRDRVLYEGINALNVGIERITSVFIDEFDEICTTNTRSFEKSIKNINFAFDNEYIYIKRKELLATESMFFVIIKESGMYDFPFGSLEVSVQNEEANLIFYANEEAFLLKGVRIPFCIRSRQLCDKVLNSLGYYKNVSDILSDWKVPAAKKTMIPLIQELDSKEQSIIAIIGSVYGFENWIVKGSFNE